MDPAVKPRGDRGRTFFMLLKDVFEKILREIKPFSATAVLDAEVILMHALKMSKSELIAHPERVVTDEEQNLIFSLVKKAKEQEPIAYIVGSKSFWEYDFIVNDKVLIPRPESELIIEKVLQYKPDKQEKLRILDLGIGSGCLLISLLKEYSNAYGIGVDISAEAIEIAEINAKNLVLNQNSIRLIKSDWLSNVDKQIFDVVVANPPYISRAEYEDLAKPLKYEPKGALTDDAGGYDCYFKILDNIKFYMGNHSLLILEHGYNQASKLRKILEEADFNVLECAKDLAGLERVIISKLS